MIENEGGQGFHRIEGDLRGVVPGAERIGHEAAELLDRMMDGGGADESTAGLDRRIEPLGVVTRQSTLNQACCGMTFAAVPPPTSATVVVMPRE